MLTYKALLKAVRTDLRKLWRFSFCGHTVALHECRQRSASTRARPEEQGTQKLFMKMLKTHGPRWRSAGKFCAFSIDQRVGVASDAREVERCARKDRSKDGGKTLREGFFSAKEGKSASRRVSTRPCECARIGKLRLTLNGCDVVLKV